MTKTSKATETAASPSDVRELSKIMRITMPWNETTVERAPWTVTLKSGREVQIACPLGAAVLVEEAGHMIAATPSAECLRIQAEWDAAGISTR